MSKEEIPFEEQPQNQASAPFPDDHNPRLEDAAEIDQAENTTHHTETGKEMEVHHHGHVHEKKKWKEYVFQFFMLFLAVFCGFLAEYQLEHLIEHQREKQYVHSLIEDLKNDQELISKHIGDVKKSSLMMDTIVKILNNPGDISSRTGDLYYLARLGPRLQPLSTNNRTIEQLTNSGNFRLIRNLPTSNKIIAYYEKFPLIRLLENINETEFTEYKKAAAKIFDPAVFIEMEGENGIINRSIDNPPIRTTDNNLLQELSVFAVYIRGTRKGIAAGAEELKASGADLLKYLQSEYKVE